MYPPPVAYSNLAHSPQRGMGPFERLAQLSLLSKAVLIIAAAGFVFWVVGPGGASSSSSSSSTSSYALRPSSSDSGGGGGGGVVGPNSRKISLEMWSHTFGRDLRDGEGELCDFNSHLARTSSHALLNVAGRDEFGAYMDQVRMRHPANKQTNIQTYKLLSLIFTVVVEPGNGRTVARMYDLLLVCGFLWPQLL